MEREKCMWSPATEEFFEYWGSHGGVLCADALGYLFGLAVALLKDTGPIEAGHASSRRQIFMRSVHTHSMELRELNADKLLSEYRSLRLELKRFLQSAAVAENADDAADGGDTGGDGCGDGNADGFH